MKAANNKIFFELLDEEFQPKKTIFNPNATMLKLSKVISVGCKTEVAKVGDIITTYVSTNMMIDSKKGFCSERDVIFFNDIPQPNKVHIKNQSGDNLSLFTSAEVINSNSEDIMKNQKIFYRKGQSHILPDNTEIISDTQIYYIED